MHSNQLFLLEQIYKFTQILVAHLGTFKHLQKH